MHASEVPTAWQGSFSNGKEKNRPTIILEGLCDYNLWFWNCFFGCCGSFNDINVLKLSNLPELLTNGTFEDLEKRAGTVPFKILQEEFERMFILVDGIYPPYSRFVKGIKDPNTQQEKYYTKWQEGARKDINMGVSDRIIQMDCKATYNPAAIGCPRWNRGRKCFPRNSRGHQRALESTPGR